MAYLSFNIGKETFKDQICILIATDKCNIAVVIFWENVDVQYWTLKIVPVQLKSFAHWIRLIVDSLLIYCYVSYVVDER